MTTLHRIETVITQDGELSLRDLPFRAGDAVEVIVQPVAHFGAGSDVLHPMRGMVIRFDDPTAPVAEADWGVLQ